MISTYSHVLVRPTIVISGCTHKFVAIVLNDRPSPLTLSAPPISNLNPCHLHILVSPLFSLGDLPHQGPLVPMSTHSKVNCEFSKA